MSALLPEGRQSRQGLMTTAELAPLRVKDFQLPRRWHEKCGPHWHASANTGAP